MLCGGTEVPVSSQWNADGYYYPTQIAQYALSHYSKYIVEQRHSDTTQTRHTLTPRDWSAMTGERWRRTDETSGTTAAALHRTYDATVQRSVYHFKSPG